MSFITRATETPVTFSAPRMIPRDWCPHCERSTHWHLSLWEKHTRCLDCGQNPLHAPTEVLSK